MHKPQIVYSIPAIILCYPCTQKKSSATQKLRISTRKIEIEVVIMEKNVNKKHSKRDI